MAFQCCELMWLIAFAFASRPFFPFFFLSISLFPCLRSGFLIHPAHCFLPLVLLLHPLFPLGPSLPFTHPHPLLHRGNATESLWFKLAHADPTALARAQHTAKTSSASLLWGDHRAAEDACGGTEDSCLYISSGRGRDMLGQRPFSWHNTPCTETSIANHGNSLEASHMDCHLHCGCVQLSWLHVPVTR